MEKAHRGKLEKILGGYFKEIRKIYVAGGSERRAFYDFALKVDDLLHMCNITEVFG
jgi:hypothetical protein